MQKLSEWLRSVRPLRCLLLLALAAVAVLMLTGSRSAQSTAPTELEARLERTLSAIEGAGRVRVMVTRQETQAVSAFAAVPSEGAVQGVLVVAQGADDLRVVFALTRAVQALMNVDASRIEIVKMQEVD